MASRGSGDDGGQPSRAELELIQRTDPGGKLCALQDLVRAVEALPQVALTREQAIREKLSPLSDARDIDGIKQLQAEIAQLTERIQLIEQIQSFAKLKPFSTDLAYYEGVSVFAGFLKAHRKIPALTDILREFDFAAIKAEID